MRIGTLFSGIGAPEQAAARVWPNHEIAFACEYDKFARQSYKAIYDIADEHFHTDVRQMDGTAYEGKVDVLVWGFPCTSYSIAGLRKGMDDEKTGDLFHQGLRILKQCKPKYTIIENVKGLLSIDGGKTIELIMRDLREAGYFCHYEVINSKDYGIPQNRERVFIVGFREPEPYYRFQFAPPVRLDKRIKDILEESVDEKYYLSQKAISGFIEHKKRHSEKGNGFAFEPKSPDTIATCLQTKYGARPTDTYIQISNNRIRKLTPLECWRLQDFPDEAHEKAKVAGVSDSMRYKQSGNSMTVAVVEMIFRQIDKALKGCIDNTSLFGVVQ